MCPWPISGIHPQAASQQEQQRQPAYRSALSTFLGTGATLVAEMHRQRVAEAGILMAEYAPEPPFPTGSVEQAPPDLVAILERGLSGFVSDAAQLKL